MRSVQAFAPLLFLTAFLSVVSSAYVAAGTPPPPALADLAPYALSWALLAWIQNDARRRRIVPCYDFGFLVAVVLPVSLVWYVLWSRGWKGVALLAGFVGLQFIPWVSSVAVWVALRSL
jgi:hypothetical protein